MNATRLDMISKLFATRRSRRQALAQAGAGLAAAVGAAGLAHRAATAAQDEAATPSAAASAENEGPVFLFLQAFQAGSVAAKEGSEGRYTLTLEQGLGHTVYFSDRPDRIVGATPTPQFLQGLGFPDDNPPNAALVVETDRGADRARRGGAVRPDLRRGDADSDLRSGGAGGVGADGARGPSPRRLPTCRPSAPRSAPRTSSSTTARTAGSPATRGIRRRRSLVADHSPVSGFAGTGTSRAANRATRIGTTPGHWSVTGCTAATRSTPSGQGTAGPPWRPRHSAARNSVHPTRTRPLTEHRFSSMLAGLPAGSAPLSQKGPTPMMIKPLPRTTVRARDLTVDAWHAHVAARQPSRLIVVSPDRTAIAAAGSSRRISLAPISIQSWLAHLSGQDRRSA